MRGQVTYIMYIGGAVYNVDLPRPGESVVNKPVKPLLVLKIFLWAKNAFNGFNIEPSRVLHQVIIKGFYAKRFYNEPIS